MHDWTCGWNITVHLLWPTRISPITFDTQRVAKLLRVILDIGMEAVILSYGQDAEVPLLSPRFSLWAQMLDNKYPGLSWRIAQHILQTICWIKVCNIAHNLCIIGTVFMGPITIPACLANNHICTCRWFGLDPSNPVYYMGVTTIIQTYGQSYLISILEPSIGCICI